MNTIRSSASRKNTCIALQQGVSQRVFTPSQTPLKVSPGTPFFFPPFSLLFSSSDIPFFFPCLCLPQQAILGSTATRPIWPPHLHVLHAAASSRSPVPHSFKALTPCLGVSKEAGKNPNE